ncbi:uncharacterized protein LOC143579885 [Bidens hawaiensis]|uniref:uncharacterized protein LOC143579885 n=1 Tax=Bidens hawaiensis TaxID=980011 RepID=UPI00404A43D7
MKLNPAKCSFGMEEGKFIRVIVTGAGFKANPDKVQAVARIPSPFSLKEVQTLNGRLVALNRFLANHAAKSYPFVSTLRNYLKKAKFRWITEAEQAFLEVKKCLMELPTLTAPYAGEPLTMYLSASDIAIGAVLLTDRKNVQTPIYYAKDLMLQFSSCKVIHIKKSENKSANALSKLASTNFEHFAKDIRIEILDLPSIPQHKVLVIQTGVESWMTPITAYLSSGALPEGKAEARKIKHKALNYQIHDSVLYRRSFLGPLLRCVDAEDMNYLIREVHEGICGLHAGPRTVVGKLMNAGYYWPGMHLDAVHEIRKCDSCQRHALNMLRPKNELVPVTSAWPF